MASTSITFRMDEELKKNLEKTCQELGMSVTTAFTIFAKKMCREQRIPFEVSVDPFYSESNRQALLDSVRQAEQGKLTAKGMDELEAMANG